jgi:hypothetical protein
LQFFARRHNHTHRYLRGKEVTQAINDLAANVSPADFQEKFGVGTEQLQMLLESKAITIQQLMEIVRTLAEQRRLLLFQLPHGFSRVFSLSAWAKVFFVGHIGLGENGHHWLVVNTRLSDSDLSLIGINFESKNVAWPISSGRNHTPQHHNTTTVSRRYHRSDLRHLRLVAVHNGQ